MANTANTASSSLPLETQLQDLLNPSLLAQIHNIRFPYPKSSPINWQAVVNNLWEPNPEVDRTLYRLCFPIWRAMTHMPLDSLLALHLPSLLLNPSSPDYLLHCLGLIYLLDQSRSSFRGTDMRYSHSLFDPLAENAAASLFAEDLTRGHGIPSPASPFSKHAWLTRGWTFEHYAARVDWLWAPLIHSERYMSGANRALNRGFILHLRAEVEAYSGAQDPYAACQAADEADLFLLPRITGGEEIPAPTASNLGRDPGMADYVFWMLRMNTAHFAVVDRFGRYPYQNDQMGRLFGEDGEEEKWMEKAYPRGRLPGEWREAIRRDVVEGRWTEWKGEGRERMGWVDGAVNDTVDETGAERMNE